ncbi:hypothetical protein LPJ78_002597 [Coemansia sp. RSA 989]|nr:putative DnaJ chaperone [Coemansia mojavensis]KAJ1739939.1 hypothetical protein LPJ68_004228 [Coemansia sp. RSA 1086]KAJ1751295.1 hypothetical protein LPJ79_002170 [Coemansia sp. RSA 1821]KAJ1865589.1 hypothetical protein LPJ78_002597 [Coemansia sp. RSA 989]KAJ1873484.1 hypothetical protein LPJ55_002232 [Coemansia sp. RSA 990]KAJ2633094.1 hypothetical protein H4R22_000730 [Coemansia sp. RSA 1290]KAJ2650357.1 hypothetical protein IWW40_002534 [Coemansia sp. RSA 1250]KAJ2675600.1 hypothetic
MNKTDYYQLLGVSPTATESEIRSAYMRKALQAHPDRNPSPNATKEFQQIADAYYTLSDSTRRANYDQQRAYSGAEHVDADDVFGDVFEDVLRDQFGQQSAGWFWSWLGLLGGGILGFIVANLPGAFVGGFAGRQLGSVRDHTGKPVYDSFKELPHSRKVQVLSAIAAQVLGAGTGK